MKKKRSNMIWLILLGGAGLYVWYYYKQNGVFPWASSGALPPPAPPPGATNAVMVAPGTIPPGYTVNAQGFLVPLVMPGVSTAPPAASPAPGVSTAPPAASPAPGVSTTPPAAAPPKVPAPVVVAPKTPAAPPAAAAPGSLLSHFASSGVSAPLTSTGIHCAPAPPIPFGAVVFTEAQYEETYKMFGASMFTPNQTFYVIGRGIVTPKSVPPINKAFCPPAKITGLHSSPGQLGLIAKPF